MSRGNGSHLGLRNQLRLQSCQRLGTPACEIWVSTHQIQLWEGHFVVSIFMLVHVLALAKATLLQTLDGQAIGCCLAP